MSFDLPNADVGMAVKNSIIIIYDSNGYIAVLATSKRLLMVYDGGINGV